MTSKGRVGKENKDGILLSFSTILNHDLNSLEILFPKGKSEEAIKFLGEDSHACKDDEFHVTCVKQIIPCHSLFMYKECIISSCPICLVILPHTKFS